MGQKEKLIKRLKTRPKDFSFDELERLLGYLSFEKDNKGRTSGSQVLFRSEKHSVQILLHKPHPGNELRDYQIRQVLEILEQEELI